MEVSSWRYDPWEAWVEMGVQPPTAKIGCTYVVISFFHHGMMALSLESEA